ncbi:ABC transporter substrate-binding protein, partial [Mesorhizobium sp. M5C.F.Ca.IN.020.32.2.1]
MMISRRGTLRLAALGTAAALVSKPSFATSKVRIGVLKFGTVSWALDTMKQHKFDTANGIGLEIVDFAGEDATNVAMLA